MLTLKDFKKKPKKPVSLCFFFSVIGITPCGILVIMTPSGFPV